MQALLDKVSAFGSQIAPKLKGSGAKGKPTAAETRAYRTLSKGIEDEKCLAERLEELVPAYDKEEAVGWQYAVKSVAYRGVEDSEGPTEDRCCR